MYNFVMMHEVWRQIIIGCIRGFRRGWPGLRDAVKGVEPNKEPEHPSVNQVAAMLVHPDFMALEKARDVVMERINSGKRYKSVEDIFEELHQELKFQRITLRTEL